MRREPRESGDQQDLWVLRRVLQEVRERAGLEILYRCVRVFAVGVDCGQTG